VGIQLSVDEYLGGIAITPEDTEAQLEVLAASGLFDYFDISTGAAYSNHWTIPTMEVPEAFLAPFGKRAKEIVGGRAKIFLVGRVRDLSTAARLVDEGCADMIAMTRAHIADPFLVRKALEGRADETIRCIGENECMLRVSLNREVTCFLNPATGRELHWGDGTVRRVAPPQTRRVVVVGGGAAGMQAAAAAARRGHTVALVERERELGGQLALLRRLPGRSDWQDAIDSLATALRVAGVETRLGVEADGALLEAERPDTVLCATGATWDRTGFSPQRPELDVIPGAEQANVVDIATATRRALEDASALGKRVLVVDETGDYLPVGLADLLSAAGIQVEIVTRHPLVGHNLHATLDAPFVFPRLLAAGVRLTPQHFLAAVEEDTVELVDAWGVSERRRDGVDHVVLAMLRTPDERLFREVESLFPDVRRIGDALAPRRLPEVIYEGEQVGREL